MEETTMDSLLKYEKDLSKWSKNERKSWFMYELIVLKLKYYRFIPYNSVQKSLF